MIHPLRVNGISEWKLNGFYERWVAEERRPSTDSGTYGMVQFKTKKDAQEAVHALNATHRRGYDQGVYDLLMLLVEVAGLTPDELEAVFYGMTDSDATPDEAKDALSPLLTRWRSLGYRQGVGDLLYTLGRQGRLMPARAGDPQTREEILASLTAQGCPNPWHHTAPARMKQSCPECPDGVPPGQ